MKLWLLGRIDHWSYDDYDIAVVAAETAEEAKAIHPASLDGDGFSYGWTTPENITAKLIGDAAHDVKPGVVCASFNAG